MATCLFTRQPWMETQPVLGGFSLHGKKTIFLLMLTHLIIRACRPSILSATKATMELRASHLPKTHNSLWQNAWSALESCLKWTQMWTLEHLSWGWPRFTGQVTKVTLWWLTFSSRKALSCASPRWATHLSISLVSVVIVMSFSNSASTSRWKSDATRRKCSKGSHQLRTKKQETQTRLRLKCLQQ